MLDTIHENGDINMESKCIVNHSATELLGIKHVVYGTIKTFANPTNTL